VKFEPQFFIEECVSRDETRPHLVSAHLDKAKARLVATDGHMLVAIPVKVEAGDVDGPVPKEALREARSHANRTRYSRKKGDDGLPRIRVGKRLLDTGGAIYRRPPPCTFPPWELVIPTVEPGEPGTVTIGFNPHLFVAVAKAIGEGTRRPFVQVTFKLPNAGQEALEPFVIRAGNGSGEAIAVVMPARTGVIHESKAAKKAKAA
jgi:hypothetical protein